MRKTMFILFCGCALFSAVPLTLRAVGDYPIFHNNEIIRVQYQARRPGTPSWTTYSTTLRDARTESMIRNQLLKRHPGYEVRVLSASVDGRNVQSSVQCQIRRGENSSWTTMTTTVTNALTESMAESQIAARYPGSEVRILSMSSRSR